MTRRVAVTGVGLVSALGQDANESFERLVRGERGFSDVTLFDTAGQRTRFAAQMRGFRPEDIDPMGQAPRFSRSDALALAAARQALTAAGHTPGVPRLGISVGVTTAGMLEAERSFGAAETHAELVRGTADFLVSYPLSSTADRLSEVLGPSAQVATICSACSSGASALVEGAAWLLSGTVDVVLAGGADALCALTFTGFNALGAMDASPCRPFDARRAGLTLGEGAAFLVIEREEDAVRRGAAVSAWFSGWAAGAEAYHVTQPEPSGKTPARLIARALAAAGLSPADIDYVNAHGTGTLSNDAVETLALRAALGPEAERILVSSSKGQLGHTLGAAGALEAAITVLALAKGKVPPTGGLKQPDEACGLRHVPGVGRDATLRAAASVSLGFGGTGTVVVFEAPGAHARSPGGRSSRVVVTGAATIGVRGLRSGVDCAVEGAGDVVSAKRAPLDLVVPARSRRFDTHACLAAASAEAALASGGCGVEGTGLVWATAFGNVERTVRFLRTAREKGPHRVPPAEFPHLVPSAASGNASIYLGLTGPVLTTCDLEASGEGAFHLAADWLEAGIADAFVAGAAEAFDPIVAELLGPVCEGSPRASRTEGAGSVVLEREEVAKARGAVPLAVVRARHRVPSDRLATLTLPAPIDVERAVIVSTRPLGELLPPCLAGWTPARRRVVQEVEGWNDALGGFALAVGAALIARGEATDVLVHGGNARRTSLVVLARGP